MGNALVFAGNEVPLHEDRGKNWVYAADLAPLMGLNDPNDLYDLIRDNREEFWGMGHACWVSELLLRRRRSNSRAPKGRKPRIMLDCPGVLKILMLTRTKLSVAFREWAATNLILMMEGKLLPADLQVKLERDRLERVRLEIRVYNRIQRDKMRALPTVPSKPADFLFEPANLVNPEAAAVLERSLKGQGSTPLRKRFIQEVKILAPWAKRLSRGAIVARLRRRSEVRIRNRSALARSR